MEALVSVTILEEEDDLLIYCMGEGVRDIFKKRKDEYHYCALIGRYLMDSEVNLLAPELFFLILAHPVYKM